MLTDNRVGQFVSVVLEYAVVLERKDRWVVGAMVVMVANDQGSVVVLPLGLCCVVLCCVVLQGKSIRELRESQFVSVVLE